MQKYHLIGIGGIGMSGLAKLLKQQGHDVQGSDLAPSYVTENLRELGIPVFLGHDCTHVPKGAHVIFNTDIRGSNPELMLAQEQGYPLMHRSDLLVFLASKQDTLAVTGTHGKTTTSSLLAHLFLSACMDPSFAIGGIMQSVQTNARFGSSSYFVLEADESDGTFVKYPYYGACVTNIDTDHLAYFGSWDKLVSAFDLFLKRSKNPDTLFYCKDDPTLALLAPTGVSYGFSQDADLRAMHFRQEQDKIVFDIDFRGKRYTSVEVSLAGRHNALNAMAAFGLALACGLSEEQVRLGLSSFKGVKRRLEKKKMVNGVVFFDDYAHHPTEIEATLKALKETRQANKVVALFQPHRYSRMRYVLDEIGPSFASADSVIVTDLYTAGEMPVPGVSTEVLYEKIKRVFHGPCHYIPRERLYKEVWQYAAFGDIVITLGAGDITYLSEEV
jgi:UDP-N-acetylmuramate--alanine ligase